MWLSKIVVWWLILMMNAFNSPAQMVFYQDGNGPLLDSFMYERIKSAELKKLTDQIRDGHTRIKIIDHFTSVRRTADSIIYSFTRTYEKRTEYPSDYKIREKEEFLNKPFNLPPFVSIYGQPVSADSLNGKPSLICFWFTTCQTCVDDIHALNHIKKQMGDSVHLIAITFERKRKLKSFLRKHPFHFIQIADAGLYQDTLGLLGFPTYIFLGKEGIVRDVRHDVPLDLNTNEANKGQEVGKSFIDILRRLM